MKIGRYGVPDAGIAKYEPVRGETWVPNEVTPGYPSIRTHGDRLEVVSKSPFVMMDLHIEQPELGGAEELEAKDDDVREELEDELSDVMLELLVTKVDEADDELEVPI